jgi:hypothetical protein
MTFRRYVLAVENHAPGVISHSLLSVDTPEEAHRVMRRCCRIFHWENYAEFGEWRDNNPEHHLIVFALDQEMYDEWIESEVTLWGARTLEDPLPEGLVEPHDIVECGGFIRAGDSGWCRRCLQPAMWHSNLVTV